MPITKGILCCFFYIYIPQLKVTTTNITYILCRSWRRKTQGHLASTKNDTFNFQKSIIPQKKKAKEKKYTQQTTQHSEKNRDWQLHTYPCNGYNPFILNFHQLCTIKSKFESTMMKIARYLENLDRKGILRELLRYW